MTKNIIIRDVRELISESYKTCVDDVLNQITQSPLRGLWQEQSQDYEMRLLHMD